MKKILSIILILGLLFLQCSFANAVSCKPKFTGNRTVEADCTFDQSSKIYGNIIVADKVVTVNNGITLGIDLSVNKITFTTGKMLFTGTAKADNSTTNHYVVNITYSEGSPYSLTQCPAGMKVVNAAGTAILPDNPTTYPTPTGAAYFDAVPANSTMQCAWP